jgi:phosphoserine phosphatase
VFRTVVFDCDSTLTAVEGIEELAHARRAEIAALTESAMRGDVPLEAVYGKRLEIIRPSRSDVDALGRRYVERLVDDARELVGALRANDVEVCIVSGGLRPAVAALARELGLDDSRVAAVDIFFDASGAYAGYDGGSPLARSGGKRDVLAEWSALPRPVMLVGDGATDLEARDAVDLFVAFAGVARHERVVREAGFVIAAPSLAPVLNLALLGHRPTDAPSIALWEKGAAIVSAARAASSTREPS